MGTSGAGGSKTNEIFKFMQSSISFYEISYTVKIFCFAENREREATSDQKYTDRVRSIMMSYLQD